MPSQDPSKSPTTGPSDVPSAGPSRQPTGTPSEIPSDLPSELPSLEPSSGPSPVPTMAPTNEPKIVSFTLVNADTGEDVEVLPETDAIVDLSIHTYNLNIRANPQNIDDVDGVDFVFNGVSYGTEYHFPYSLGSNQGTEPDSPYLPTPGLKDSDNYGGALLEAKPWVLEADGETRVYGPTYQITVNIVPVPVRPPRKT